LLLPKPIGYLGEVLAPDEAIGIIVAGDVAVSGEGVPQSVENDGVEPLLDQAELSVVELNDTPLSASCERV